MIAAFAAAYAGGDPASSPDPEEMNSRHPPPAAVIQGTTFHVARTEAIRSMLRLASHPAGSSVLASAEGLLTKISTLPRCRLASSRKASKPAVLPMSQVAAYTATLLLRSSASV